MAAAGVNSSQDLILTANTLLKLIHHPSKVQTASPVANAAVATSKILTVHRSQDMLDREIVLLI